MAIPKVGIANATRDDLLNSTRRNKTLLSIIDVLARLPPLPRKLEKQAPATYNVAVCIAGHVRTFIEPGVYTSIAANLIGTAPGGAADAFVVGHLGGWKGSKGNELEYQTWYSQHAADLNDPNSAAIQNAVKAPGMHTKVSHISEGTCSDLEQVWHHRGISGRTCIDDRSFLQIMWLDICIQDIKRSLVQYDLIVRTRPDVGIFAPLPWASVSQSTVSYTRKADSGNADWFFTMPMSTVDTWWEHIVSYYAQGSTDLPDYHLMNVETMNHVVFPVAIVRSPTVVECERIPDYGVSNECQDAAYRGYFGEAVHQN